MATTSHVTGTLRSARFAAAAAMLTTPHAIVRFAVTEFRRARLTFGHGSVTALDEAAYLVKFALRLPIHGAQLRWKEPLPARKVRAALRLIERRVIEQLPAPYLTHEAWIGRHRFYVDRRVIVPRSFIGHWLDADLGPWFPKPRRVARALDLCTGSGCLAIMLALTFPRARIDAIDVSAGALRVAQRNVSDYGLQARIALMRGDLFTPASDRRYDVIVSNPPYVTAAAMRKLPAEYRHEPSIALAGGSDGLEFLRRILACAHAHLVPDGKLVVEVGHARARVEAAFPRVPFTWIEIGAVDDAVFLLDAASLRGGPVSPRPA